MKFVIIKKKMLILAVIAVISMVILSIPYEGGASASVFFGTAPRLVPIYSVESDEKKVAISFDTAWGADKTEGILDILKQYDVRATFFMVGFWVEDYPDMVKKIDEQGIEIGTHSNTHPDFVKLSQEQMELELTTSISSIEAITNKPVKLFRAPYGSYNNEMLKLTDSMGLKTIQWDVDTLDWKGLSGTEICERVMSRVKNGSIILCHNNADHVLEALPLMLERLINAGYDVVSVGDLIIEDDYYIDNLGVQRKN
ncbi:MAG: deacetylase [Clostridiales bacterium]|nr:deacetylase [Clostridiales bacterium]